MNLICGLCRTPIPAGTESLTYEEHVGWARRRDQGGLNALVARRPTGRVACHRCVNDLRKGLTPGQDELFDASLPQEVPTEWRD